MLDWQFLLLLLSNGILIGLMYSLIALGFVLVYKATDALNFAQGEFVMLAGFAVAAGLGAYHAPLWLVVLADDDRLLDVGAELQLVLEELGGERGAIGEARHVFDAVDHHEVAVGVQEPRVPGVEPAVADRKSTRLNSSHRL